MKYSSSFTHDLDFGEKAEDWVNDIFKSGKKVEVKHDRIAHKTGNVFIEYESRNKPSGIATTDADYWVYKLEQTECAIILPVSYLKGMLRECFKQGKYMMDGGDNNTSKGFLIPIQKLITREI